MSYKVHTRAGLTFVCKDFKTHPAYVWLRTSDTHDAVYVPWLNINYIEWVK